jgi:hypothetical protein
MADIDMFDLVRKLAPDIEKNMPESVKEALEGGNIRSIFRTSASAGDTTPGSIYLTHDDGRVARYGRHGMGWDDYRADTVGGKNPLTKDDPWFFTRSLFHKKGTTNPSSGIPVSDLEDLIKKGDLLTNPIAGRMLFESREEAGVVAQIHAGDLLSDVYNRDGSVSFLDDLANRSRTASVMPGVIESSIDDIELTERSASATIGTVKKRQPVIPQLKSPSSSVSEIVDEFGDDISGNVLSLDDGPTGKIVTDDIDDFSGNILSLDEDDAPAKKPTGPSKVGRPIISSDPPKTGISKVKTPKVSPEVLDRLPSRVHGSRAGATTMKAAPGKRPGAVGGVAIGSKARPSTVSKVYPKPLPFMHDTNELNKLRPLPKAKPSILSSSSVTAAISAAPGSAPSAVASAVATTPAGASVAVKSFIKNKASSVSGSSVIRKFANRKSIAVGGLAAVGLATSIATSKNRLQDKEQRR